MRNKGREQNEEKKGDREVRVRIEGRGVRQWEKRGRDRERGVGERLGVRKETEERERAE